MKRISVCMATYNGSKYIKEQIESILIQLEEDSEIIIVDDNSSDNTVKIIEGFSDIRIKLLLNEDNKGINYSFEKALSMATGDYIFLADQDDIWTSGRVEKMIFAIDSNHEERNFIVSGNSLFINSLNEIIQYPIKDLKPSDSNKMIKNILLIFLGKASYFGCTMCLKKELLKIGIPFPKYIESHDLWLAKCAILLGGNKHISDIVLERRVHESNASIIKRGIFKKIISRIVFLKSIVNIIARIIKSH